MTNEEMRGRAVRYKKAKAASALARQTKRFEKELGATFFTHYKNLPEAAKDEFRRLMEEDWREHRKFDADPSEEIIEAEVIEE